MTELRFNLNDKVVSVCSKHVYVIRGISTYSYRIEYECERLSDNKRISFEEYELELYVEETDTKVDDKKVINEMKQSKFNIGDKVKSVYGGVDYVVFAVDGHTHNILYRCMDPFKNEFAFYADEIFLVESVEQKNDLEAPIITTEDIAKELFGL